MTSCIFCSIVAGHAPSTRVYEDDELLAFLDIRPVMRGHTLVIPKAHAGQLDDLDLDVGARMFRVGHQLARAVRRCDLVADGANLVLNDGKAAFQTVAHTHLHVVPRRNGDKLSFVRGLILRRSTDPEGAAASIRAALRQE